MDSVKDTPEKVWEIFDDFLRECENQLEIDSGFLKQLQGIDLEKDFITIKSSEE